METQKVSGFAFRSRSCLNVALNSTDWSSCTVLFYDLQVPFDSSQKTLILSTYFLSTSRFVIVTMLKELTWFCCSYMQKVFVHRQTTIICGIRYLQISETNYVTLTRYKSAAQNPIGHWHSVFLEIRDCTQKKYSERLLIMHCNV